MEDQQFKSNSFLHYVGQIQNAAEKKSLTYYAIDSFLKAAERHGIEVIDGEALRLWLASMLMAGMSMKTAQRYFGRIHSVYCRWATADASDPFDGLQFAFSLPYETDEATVARNFDAMRRLFATNEASPDWLLTGIFFYLLYNAEATIADAIALKFDDAPRYCPQIEGIIRTRDSSKGRRYVFSLGQSGQRPKRIETDLTERLAAMMRTAGLKTVTQLVREEITAIWIAAALRCGIDLRDIRSVIPAVPHRYSALSLVAPRKITEERRHEIICTVADEINDNTPRWFVMKMRKGVTADGIKESIGEKLPGRLAAMTLYYPTRTVVRISGKKQVKEAVPYVPNILFFQTQYNKVRSLFAKIGDLAYCLKESNRPESRYSIISHEEMARFQKCVGQFTDDIRMELSASGRGLGKGRMVMITGGMMKGYRGKIEDIDDSKGTRTFFLQVTNENALKWTAEVDEVYITPLSCEL